MEGLCYTNSHKAVSESEAVSATAKQLRFITLEPHFKAQAACLSTFIVPHHHGQTCCSLTLGVCHFCLALQGSSLPALGMGLLLIPEDMGDTRMWALPSSGAAG